MEPQPPALPVDFATLRGSIQSRFMVLDAFIDENNVPTFILQAEPVKTKFKELVAELKRYGLFGVIRNDSRGLVLRAITRPTLRRPRPVINIALFAATVATILFASRTLIYGADPRIIRVLFNGSDLNVQVVSLAASILAIIGLHEFGHKLAARFHGLEATHPYFIPGPPPFGTFGAMISLRSPPVNKDQLFDLGLSGPLLGFLATLAVAVLAYLTAPLVPITEVRELLTLNLVRQQAWPDTPLLLLALSFSSLRSVPSNMVPVLTQTAFAAEIGALITFLNILPVWQLDGGHISRALWGRDGNKIASAFGLGVLILARYWFFAVFLVVLMLGSRRAWTGVEPLDDVSPLSASRKLMFAVAVAMLVLCFVILG